MSAGKTRNHKNKQDGRLNLNSDFLTQFYREPDRTLRYLYIISCLVFASTALGDFYAAPDTSGDRIIYQDAYILNSNQGNQRIHLVPMYHVAFPGEYEPVMDYVEKAAGPTSPENTLILIENFQDTRTESFRLQSAAIDQLKPVEKENFLDSLCKLGESLDTVKQTPAEIKKFVRSFKIQEDSDGLMQGYMEIARKHRLEPQFDKLDPSFGLLLQIDQNMEDFSEPVKLAIDLYTLCKQQDKSCQDPDVASTILSWKIPEWLGKSRRQHLLGVLLPLMRENTESSRVDVFILWGASHQQYFVNQLVQNEYSIKQQVPIRFASCSLLAQNPLAQQGLKKLPVPTDKLCLQKSPLSQNDSANKQTTNNLTCCSCQPNLTDNLAFHYVTVSFFDHSPREDRFCPFIKTNSYIGYQSFFKTTEKRTWKSLRKMIIKNKKQLHKTNTVCGQQVPLEKCGF